MPELAWLTIQGCPITASLSLDSSTISAVVPLVELRTGHLLDLRLQIPQASPFAEGLDVACNSSDMKLNRGQAYTELRISTDLLASACGQLMARLMARSMTRLDL